MATETSTLAVSTAQAKRLHEGAQTVSGVLTGVGTSSAGNIYRLCHLPKGAKVSDVKISAGIGVTTTDVGVTEDDNIFIAAVSASPALAPTPINVAAGLAYVTTTSTYLIATTDAVSAASTGGTLRFAITYHVD